MLRQFSYLVIAFIVSFTATAQPSNTQNAPSSHDRIQGENTYRSFHNRPEPVVEGAEKPLGLIFAEAILIFEPPSGPPLRPKSDSPGEGLDRAGAIRPSDRGSFVIDLVGSGPTRHINRWLNITTMPNSLIIDRTVSTNTTGLGDSVLRAKPHGSAPAGYAASLLAVKAHSAASAKSSGICRRYTAPPASLRLDNRTHFFK